MMILNKKEFKIIFSLLILFRVSALAQYSNYTYDAWEKKDFKRLVDIYNTYPNAQNSVLDALANMSDNDFEGLSYEYLVEVIKLCPDSSIIKDFFNGLLIKSQSNIISDISNMRPSGIDSYTKLYPQRVDLIQDVLTTSFSLEKDSLSVQELLFLRQTLPQIATIELDKELNTRENEVHSIIKSRVDEYLQEEHQYLSLLYYVIERKIYAYLYIKFKQFCNQYAQIGDVPNTTEDIERQFRTILSRNVNNKELQKYLQLEADNYCKVINSARETFSESTGNKKFIPLKISIPNISFNYTADNDILSKIPQARTDYAESKQNVNKVASIAGLFFSGVATLIGKGIADYLVGSSLADKIINARLKYINEVYLSMEEQTTLTTNLTLKSIEKQVANNENNFRTQILK